MAVHAMFFVLQCPTCNRRLRVCVDYLGKTIQCRHCRGTFVAYDPETASYHGDPQRSLMQRVDQLLAPTGGQTPAS